MKLSIITINYNNRCGLENTIKSVVRQTFSDYEWIVVDGGSVDGSEELLEKNALNFSYWVSEKDSGIYNAMNKGIAQAKGNWLLFLNSGDCLFEKDTLEKVFLGDCSADVLYGDRVVETPDGTIVNHYPQQLSLYFFFHYSICHQATLYRRKLFDNHLYDESYSISADWAYNIDLVLRGATFKHLGFPIVIYDNNGISSKYSDLQLLEINRVKVEKFPPHVKLDIEKIDKLNFIEKRRSLKKLYNHFYNFLSHMDRVLSKLELIRKHQ